MTLEEVRAHFKQGQNGLYHCPAHADEKGSLSINAGRKNPVVLFCHAGCSTNEILRSAGLQMSDLFDRKEVNWIDYVQLNGKRKIERIYHYKDFYTGDYCFTKIRFEGKQMQIGRFSGELENSYFDCRITKDGSLSEKYPHAVYGDIQKFKQAVKDGQRVYVPEGEKDTDSLLTLGYPSITYGSSGSWHKSLSECFKNARLIILQDNDSSGRKVAEQIKNDVQGLVRSVSIVVPMPNKPHGDITDYFIEKGLL